MVTMEDKLKTVLSELSKERGSSYRKGSITLTNELDSTAPLSGIIIQRYSFRYAPDFPGREYSLWFCSSEELEVEDTDEVVTIEKFKNGGEYKVLLVSKNIITL